jgi:hypothetical protein
MSNECPHFGQSAIQDPCGSSTMAEVPVALVMDWYFLQGRTTRITRRPQDPERQFTREPPLACIREFK